MFSDGDTSEPTVVTLWLCRSVDMFVMLLLSLASIFIYLSKTYMLLLCEFNLLVIQSVKKISCY